MLNKKKEKQNKEQLTIFHLIKGQEKILDRIKRIEEYQEYIIEDRKKIKVINNE